MNLLTNFDILSIELNLRSTFSFDVKSERKEQI